MYVQPLEGMSAQFFLPALSACTAGAIPAASAAILPNGL